MKNFLLLSLILFACNPLKKAAKQTDQAQKLTDKIIASLPPVIKKDSLIFIPGALRIERDTLTNKIFTDSTTVIEHIYTNNFYHSDTVKFYYQDIATQQAQYRELQRIKAESEANERTNGFLKKLIIGIAIGLLALILIIFIVMQLLK